MIAVERYANHEYGEEDYLHYYGANAPDAYTFVHNIQRMNKALLMQNSFRALKKRVNVAQKAFKSNARDKQAAEQILSGKVFEGLGQIGYSETKIDNLPTPQTFEECQAILKNTETKLISTGNFVEMLYDVMEKITGQKKEVLEHYAAEIINEATYNSNNKKGSIGGTIGNVQKSGGTVAQAILTAILSKHNQKFFQLQGQKNGVHTDIAKMLALVKSLPEPASEGSYAVMSGSSTRQVGIASGSNEIMEALKDKIIKWMVEIEKGTAETAIVMATLKEKREVFSKLGETEKIIQRTGGKNVSVKFIPDPQQARWIKMAGTQLASRTTKVYKSDVSIFGNENQTVGQLGISVKDYGKITITGNEGVHTVHGSLDIQKGTPLLTLLMREGNLTNNRIHQLVQFAGGHEYREGASNWNQDWKEMIQNLTYRMFVDALVGLAGTQDTVTFLAINGWIYNVIDFIDSFIHSGSTASMSEYLGKYGNKNSTGGLERQTYVNLNIWQGKTDRDRYQAMLRSRKAEQSIIKLLGDTKITISLNLLRMQNLRAINF